MAKGSEKQKKKEVAAKKASQKTAADKKSKSQSQKDEAAKNGHVIKPKRATSAWIYFNTETVAKLKKEGVDHS